MIALDSLMLPQTIMLTHTFQPVQPWAVQEGESWMSVRLNVMTHHRLGPKGMTTTTVELVNSVRKLAQSNSIGKAWTIFVRRSYLKPNRRTMTS